jgi:copper oxidase (laccase) domain-containing protein
VGPEVLEEFACQFVEASEFCRPDPPNPALIMLPKQIMTGGHALMRRLDSDHGRVDLSEAARRQLLAVGLPEDQIFSSGFCTRCDRRRFYSHRREKEAAGRMLAVIGVRPGR